MEEIVQAYVIGRHVVPEGIPGYLKYDTRYYNGNVILHWEDDQMWSIVPRAVFDNEWEWVTE